jgi:hypothetical protein
VVALVDTLPIALRRCDREADFELTVFKLSGHLEAGALENAEHRPVLRHHLCDEALDALLRREHGEPLEQAGPDPAPLELVRDRERSLGGTLVAEPHVLGDRDDAIVELTDQDAAVLPVGVEEVAHKIVVDAANPVKTEVEAPLRERGEEGGEGARVLLRGRPQPQGRAVAEDDVDRGGRPVISRCCRQGQALSPLLSRARARLRARP